MQTSEAIWDFKQDMKDWHNKNEPSASPSNTVTGHYNVVKNHSPSTKVNKEVSRVVSTPILSEQISPTSISIL